MTDVGASFAMAVRRRGAASNRWEALDLCQKAASVYPKACEYVRTRERAEVHVVDATRCVRSVVSESLSSILAKLRHGDNKLDGQTD